MQTNSAIRLSQLSSRINDAIENAFHQQSFWVIADVTNHSYKAEKKYHNFDLVEKDARSNAIIAKVSAKAWGSGSSKIAEFEAITGQRFTANLQVLLQVSVEFHQLYGLSLSILNIDPNYTLGLLEQQRGATLQRLVSQNDFIQKIGDDYITDNNKLKLNPVLQRIALIASSISAGAEDFKHTLENNPFGYTFLVDDYFAAVQGDKNAGLLLERLIAVYSSGIRYDAVVITRGGGAQTDFLIFDNYRIARAAAKFPIPIITGIGHQKNQTIMDLMVNTQTKTPTKAAEFIIAHNRNFEEQLNALRKNIIIRSQQLLSSRLQKIASVKHSAATAARKALAASREDIAAIKQAVVSTSQAILHNSTNALVATTAKLQVRPKIILSSNANALVSLESSLRRYSLEYLKAHKAYLGQNRLVSGAAKSTIRTMLSQRKEHLFKVNRMLTNSSRSIIFSHRKRLVNLTASITTKPLIALNNSHNDLANKKNAIGSHVAQYLRNRNNSIENNAMAVRMMAPENILRKGYAIIRMDEQFISDPEKIKLGDTLDIILSESTITAIVKQKTENDGTGTNL